MQRTSKLANQYRQGLTRLDQSGWRPDIVVSHSGWGCGLHVKELWPECQHIAYVEWWFDPQSEFFSYDQFNTDLNFSKNQTEKHWLRNQALALELVNADIIIAPTRWQAQQLPSILRERCFVIHDGIDLELFRSGSQVTDHRASPVILTYGTRGMEPMRAFPQFIQSLPELLQIHTNLRVEIAGTDEIHYGGRPPKDHQSWGDWAKYFLDQSNSTVKLNIREPANQKILIGATYSAMFTYPPICRQLGLGLAATANGCEHVPPYGKSAKPVKPL